MVCPACPAIWNGEWVVTTTQVRKQRATKTGYEMRAVLDQEVSLVSRLLEVMRQEQELLLQSDTGSLVESTKSKEVLILQHSYLEQSRRHLTERLARELGLKNTEPRLAVLVDALDGKLAENLTELRSQLRSLVEEIEQLGTENHDLIQCSVQAVRDSWAMLKRQFFTAETYTARGASQDVSPERALLQGRI